LSTFSNKKGKKITAPILSIYFRVLSEIKRKENSSSHTLKSVPNTFRNKKEKKKAVPILSNQFRALSGIKRKEKSSSHTLEISSE